MNRSITHDPESLKGGRLLEPDHPAWIVCRKFEQFPIPSDRVLQRLAENGRVRPDDFLVDPKVDACIRARDLPQLKPIFRRATLRRIRKISSLIARAVAMLWR